MMKKCPFCAEEIQAEAIICKHCKSDLTTRTAKLALKKMERQTIKDQEAAAKEEKRKEKELRILKNQTFVQSLDKGAAKKVQQRKERVEYLQTLSPEERKAEEQKEKRNKWMNYLWWTAGITGAIAFLNNAYLAMIIFLLAIWLHPTKEETKPQLHFRFKDWSRYKQRILFSLLIGVTCFIQARSQAEEEFVRNYPIPKIEILSSQENQGEAMDYLLTFTASEAEKVLVNNVEAAEKDGKYEQSIPLENISTLIKISASNQHKNAQKDLVIFRSENAAEKETRQARETEEEKQRLAREAKKEEEARNAEAERKKQEEAERKEREAWERSKAGQLCKKHPAWSKTECEWLTENRYWIGMTSEMLVEVRGKPNSANPSNYGGETQWQWCWFNYTPSCFYDQNDDGIVDAFN